MSHQLNKLHQISSKRITQTSDNKSKDKKAHQTSSLSKEAAGDDTLKSRYLIINSKKTKPDETFDQEKDNNDELGQEKLISTDPIRALLSNKREIQIAWQALIRTIIRKHMRMRDFYDKMDNDFSGSLDYHEFESGLRQFKEIYTILSPKHVEALIRSLYPKGDSEVTWEIFDRVIQMYTAKHFPPGSFAEWSGKTLLDTRIKLRNSHKDIIKEKDKIKKLLNEIDLLKLSEINGIEIKKELTNARGQNITLVSICDETKKALTSVRKEKNETELLNLELEKLVTELRQQTAAYEQQIHGKGAHLDTARKKVLSVEEELSNAKATIISLGCEIQNYELKVSKLTNLLSKSEIENEKMRNQNDLLTKENNEYLKSKHILEMRLLEMEHSRKEVIKQLYSQKIISN